MNSIFSHSPNKRKKEKKSLKLRLQDSNWEWNLYGVEKDPDVGIRRTEYTGQNLELFPGSS